MKNDLLILAAKLVFAGLMVSACLFSAFILRIRLVDHEIQMPPKVCG